MVEYIPSIRAIFGLGTFVRRVRFRRKPFTEQIPYGIRIAAP
jgi:hypothetical protein